MSLTSPVSSTTGGTAPYGADPVTDVARGGNSPGAVLVLCLLACAAFVADAVSGEADLALLGVAVMASAVALTLWQARSAGVGRPWRRSRCAAATGAAASAFVAASLSAVAVLERMGPQVTSSAVFAAGVAVMSVVLLVVLPVALIVFGWCVAQDRRLGRWTRLVPCALVLVLAVTAVTVAVTGGSRELWLQAAAVAVAGTLLTAFRTGSSGSTPPLALPGAPQPSHRS